jgi:hypothetical protein
MIYVADLGRWVNIRPDSNLAGLFYTIQDTRSHAIRRADIVLGSSIVSRTSSPDDLSYTYFFVSPKSAASQFGEELDMKLERVVNFYDRRDHILLQNNIHVADWWNMDRFVVLEPDNLKMPVALPMDSIQRPVLAYEFSAKTGRLTPPPRIRHLIQELKAAGQIVDPIAFVEADV